MLRLHKLLCVLFAVLLVQPVFAKAAENAQPTEPTAPPKPDIVSAIHNMQELPANWSPLSPATPERQWLLTKTTTPVYKLADDGNWVPVLAQALPEDVTKDYAGTYGIPAGATGGYAYRILLSPDAHWDDGLMITADDYVFSIGKLLEDEENRENWTFLANADAILSGKKLPEDEIISLRDADFSGVRDAVSAGHTEFYVDTTYFWGLDTGWRLISDRSRLLDSAMPSGMEERFVSPAYLYSRYLADGAESSRFQSLFVGIGRPSSKTMTLEDLGVIKVSPFELVLILERSAAPSTLMQKLEKLFLFRSSCWGKDFATTAETYCGYGPYRITAADSERIILEPNPNWWGDPVCADFDRIICRTGGKD